MRFKRERYNITCDGGVHEKAKELAKSKKKSLSAWTENLYEVEIKKEEKLLSKHN